jgi:hypothetical protein
LVDSIIDRPMTLEIDDAHRGARCANCAQHISGRAVRLNDRNTLLGLRQGWLQSPIHYCAPCIQEIASQMTLEVTDQ